MHIIQQAIDQNNGYWANCAISLREIQLESDPWITHLQIFFAHLGEEELPDGLGQVSQLDSTGNRYLILWDEDPALDEILNSSFGECLSV